MTKKRSRRIIAVMMAMVMTMAMMFAMTTTSFATDGSVNVKIQMYGETYIDETVTDAQIAANVGASGHLYTVPAGITQPAGYTAADALMQAYTNFYGSFDATQVAYGWDTSWAGHEGLYFTTYDGMSGDAGKYYFVRSYEGTDEDGNAVTYYEYYWQGDSWNLYINGSNTPAASYANSYSLADTSQVVFDYNTTRTDNFSVTSPIPNAEPAPTK